MVKYTLPCFVFLLFLAGCASGGWRVIDAEEFTVEFPGQPIDTVTGDMENAGTRLYYEPVEAGIDSNVYYAVSVYNLPDSAEILGDLLESIMMKDAEIYAWSMGAIVVDSGKVVKSNTVEGREYKVFLGQNAGVVTMRKFGKGLHLYTLLVVTGNYALDNTQIYHFLDSFRLK